MESEDSSKTRPSVTFILFSFNQEEYIREAVEGAFRQDYQPMDIVLSDDCSTDSTFEIMKKMADAYEGPHNVTVVRNPANMGSFAHIVARGREAVSDIVVVAAGDDISVPQRTSRIVDAFTEEAGCVFSRVSIIDEQGNVVAAAADRPLHLGVLRLFLHHPDSSNSAKAIQGCSAAYRQWVFDFPLEPRNGSYPEDFFFNHYLLMIDADIIRLDEPLVAYRTHSRAISNYPVSNPVEYEVKAFGWAQVVRDMRDDLEKLATEIGCLPVLDLDRLDDELLPTRDSADWPDLSFSQRLGRVGAALSGGVKKSNRQRLIWGVVRLWGRYPNYQPKMFLSRFQKRFRS